MALRSLLEVTPATLAHRGPNRINEAYRRVLRFVRRVPSFERLRADGMVIGERCRAQPGVYLDAGAPHLIEIGDDVGLSINAMVLSHDGSTGASTGYTRLRSVKIGSRVFVGARAIILPGTTIGDDCIVGAGAVVKGRFPDGSVIAGVPGKVIGNVHDYAARHQADAAESQSWTVAEWRALQLSSEERTLMREQLRDEWAYVGSGVPVRDRIRKPSD